jgi:hypothetical protein
MKTKLTILILGLLLLAIPGRCFADTIIEDVSKSQAKDMGVTIRTEKNGDAGIRVWMEFKTTGKFKEFAYVEVQIGEGAGRVMSAPLQVSHPKSERENVAVQFSADPAYLPKSTLWLFVNDVPLGGTGYRFKVKDFIESESAK